SSAPRLKVLLELVTNASMTPSSTPESASLSTSATGAVGLTAGGSGFAVEMGLAGASTMLAAAAASAGAGGVPVASGVAESAATIAVPTAGGVFVAWLKDSCAEPAA